MRKEPKNIIFAKDLVTGYGTGKNFNAFPSFSINISAEEGELIALIGINGSGKTTLLKTLSGLHPAKSGDLLINNLDPTKSNRIDFAKTLSIGTTEPLKIAFTTVYDFVSLGRFPYTSVFGKLGFKDHEIIHRAILETGLEPKKYAYISELSDGERQRAIIARTLSQDTPVILFDEPTAFLDIPNKYEILNTLKSLTEKFNKTVVFSTHDLQAALQLADRVWYISKTELINKIPEQLIFDGEIDRAFNTDHVRFEKDLTNFVFLRETSCEIGLTGKGRGHLFTMNALKRLGFKIESNKKVEVNVIADEDENRISGQVFVKDKNMAYESLEELLIILKELKTKS